MTDTTKVSLQIGNKRFGVVVNGVPDDMRTHIKDCALLLDDWWSSAKHLPEPEMPGD